MANPDAQTQHALARLIGDPTLHPALKYFQELYEDRVKQLVSDDPVALSLRDILETIHESAKVAGVPRSQ